MPPAHPLSVPPAVQRRFGSALRMGPQVRTLGARRVRYVGGVALLIALYYGAAHLGYALDFAGPVASIVWLPVGVGIAFLYLEGVQFWPGVLIGDLLVNNYSALPIGVAVGQTFGNVLEVVVATMLLNRFARRRPMLRTLNGLAVMVLALAGGTALSATIGSLSLELGGVIRLGSTPGVWRTWWLGDFSGALLVVPLVVAWFGSPSPGWDRRRWIELGFALLAVAGLSVLAIRGTPAVSRADPMVSSKALGYVVFPALIWAAVRMGARGATLAVLVASGFAVWATTHYAGPFHSDALTRSVLETQLFIAVASLSSLCLAGAVAERERLAGRLFASRSRVVRAADHERLRLERDLHDGAQQRLSALIVRAAFAEETARHDPARAEAMLGSLKSEMELALEELRDLAHGSRPTALVRGGLAAALTDIANHSSIPITIGEMPSGRLPERTEITAYYVFAEGIANAQKHSKASAIRLRATQAGGLLRLEIVDDGIGGAAEGEAGGIQGLRDRVESLGGDLDLLSPVDRGTRLRAAIPTNLPA